MKRIIRFSLRWAAEPMDAVQPVNHPDPGGLCVVVRGRAFGGLQQFIFFFKRILEMRNVSFSVGR